MRNKRKPWNFSHWFEKKKTWEKILKTCTMHRFGRGVQILRMMISYDHVHRFGCYALSICSEVVGCPRCCRYVWHRKLWEFGSRNVHCSFHIKFQVASFLRLIWSKYSFAWSTFLRPFAFEVSLFVAIIWWLGLRGVGVVAPRSSTWIRTIQAVWFVNEPREQRSF
jgi:hypothetical protein